MKGFTPYFFALFCLPVLAFLFYPQLPSFAFVFNPAFAEILAQF